MNPPGDTKTEAQRISGRIGSLFSRKPGAVAHFADIISEASDVNVPGTYGNTAPKPEKNTPNTESSPKQLTTEVETIEIDANDETDSDPTTSKQRINNPNNPYSYQCNLSQEKLEKLSNDDNEEMDDDSLKAFLNIVRIESRKPVIVVSSHYRKRVPRLGLTKSLYDGDLENFEMAIIPIHMPSTEAAHWVLGIYRRNKSILYFDSLGITYGMVNLKDGIGLGLVTDWVSETLKSAARDIKRDTQLNPKIEAVPLDGPQFDNHRTKYRINPQMDGVNCGFHIALIAEAFLMNNGEVFLENFDIAAERTRILNILSGLQDGNYCYIPRSAHNTPKDADIDLEMEISNSCQNATMEKESVAKLITNVHANAPVEMPENRNQLVENTDTFNLENDCPNASNQEQSPGSTANSDEAPSNPEQQVEMPETNKLTMANDKEPFLPRSGECIYKTKSSDSESDSDYVKDDCHIEKEAPEVGGKSPNTNVDGRRYSLRLSTTSKRNSFGNCNKALGSQHFIRKSTEVELDLEYESEGPTPAKRRGRPAIKLPSRKSTEVELDLGVKHESEGPTPAKRKGRLPMKFPNSTRQATDVHLDIEDECETEGPSPAKCRGRSPEKYPSRATPKFKNMVDPIEIIIVKKLEQPTLLLGNNHHTAIIMSEKQDNYDVLQALRQRMEIASNDGLYYARNNFEANWVSIEAVLRSFGFVEDEFAFNNEFSASKKNSWKFVRSV